MKAYFSYFKLRFINSFQYRAAAIAGVCTQFFWGFMEIMIFEAFYLNGSANVSISFQDMVNYLWLQQSFLYFFMLWYRDNELLVIIKNGNISYELCRPHDIYPFWFGKMIAQRLSGAILRFFPIIIVAILLPMPYKITPPESLLSFLLFVITLSLGLVITCTISLFVHLIAFITIESKGIMDLLFIMGEFLSGSIIPVPFMPNFLKTICYIFPFRLASDLPFRTYSGNIGVTEAGLSVFLQLFWIFVLVIAGNLMMKSITKKVLVQGG